MAETLAGTTSGTAGETAGQPEARKPHHKELIGTVISNKMQKTIVVEVTRKKAHPMYKRVIAIRKKFYAHDEKNEAHTGDSVKIEESRPLSKLKRWTLKEIVRKTALVPEVEVDAGAGLAALETPGKK
jgi:small subunit ribosomal protein S17